MASNFGTILCSVFLLSTCFAGFIGGTRLGASEVDSSSVVLHAQLNVVSGEYIMSIVVGTPPVQLRAVVDTASDLSWIHCQPSVFDPTKSASFKPLPCSNQFCRDLQGNCDSTSSCSYSYSYGDGSYSDGLLASEKVTWTTLDGQIYSLDSFAFGCNQKNGEDFNIFDGVVGFGTGPLSLISQIGSPLGREFSYCFGDFNAPLNFSSSLTLGRDPNEDLSKFQFTPLIANNFHPSLYYVGLQSIIVGGFTLNIDPTVFAIDSSGNGGTIIDSRAIITSLPQAAYDAVVNHLRSTVPYPVVQSTNPEGLDLCFNMNGVAKPRFPAVALGFSGATMVLPKENTFFPFTTEQGSISCLAMTAATSSRGAIGNYMQQNFQLLFDLEGSRLGFKQEICDSGLQ